MGRANSKTNTATNKHWKVSVVIPTYNSKEYVLQAINSVLRQTYCNLEIIVVDNGSTDGTKNVLNRLIRAGSIKYIYDGRKHNAAFSRNIGIKNTTGEFIAFLDADDLWLPDKIRRQLPLFRNVNIGLVYSYCRYFGMINGYFNNKVAYGVSNCSDVYKRLIRGNFIATSSVIVRRKALTDVGYFDESAGIATIEDYDLWLRMVEIWDIDFIDRVLCKYRVHKGQTSHMSELESFERRVYLYKKLLFQHRTERHIKLICYKYLKNKIYASILKLAAR